MKHKSHNKGFTLIELLVAMTVFLVVIGVSSSIFIQTIRTQRVVTSLSKSLSNVTLVLEQIAREARTGYAFSVGGSNNKLTFTTARGEAVTYQWQQEEDEYGIGRGYIERSVLGKIDSESITADNVNISDLKFTVRDELDGKSSPSLITIFTTVLADRDIDVNLQTSVSSRILGY